MGGEKVKKDWKSPRSRAQVEAQIPASYQARDAETQDRRELTFLLQEAAFSDHIPIYCAIDLDQLPEEERELFCRVDFEPHGAIILGQTVHEMFLFAEQDVPGIHGSRPVTAAQLITENYLLDYREKLEMQGYRAEIVLPEAVPDPKAAAMMAASRKGIVGKNERFLAGSYGCQISAGLIITDAPLMGGDYRFPDVDPENSPCKNCEKCIKACPAGAITASGFDREKCETYRNDPANIEEPGTHTRLKCMACMEACDGSL
jgi:ferredoxin